MQQAIKRFLMAALGLSLFLFVVSLVFVFKPSSELDPDSMMLALLLLAFSTISSLVFVGILYWMSKQG